MKSRYFSIPKQAFYNTTLPTILKFIMKPETRKPENNTAETAVI